MVTLQTRIDDDLKASADSLFKAMGTSTTDAVRMFLVQCVNQGGLPFRPSVKRPNAETLEALSEQDANAYSDVEALSDLWK